MIGKLLKFAQETPTATATPGPGMPPMDEVFKCLAFRLMGGDMMPRISHITGGGEAAQTIPPEIEWLVPRVSCLVGLYKEGETAGRYKMGHNIGREITKKQMKSQPRGKMQEKRVGFGVDIPAKTPVREVQAVPVGQSQVTFQAAHAPAGQGSRQRAGARQVPQTQSPGRYIIRP